MMLRLQLVTIFIGLLSSFTNAATKAAQKKASDPNDNKGKHLSFFSEKRNLAL